MLRLDTSIGFGPRGADAEDVRPIVSRKAAWQLSAPALAALIVDGIEGGAAGSGGEGGARMGRLVAMASALRRAARGRAGNGQRGERRGRWYAARVVGGRRLSLRLTDDDAAAAAEAEHCRTACAWEGAPGEWEADTGWETPEGGRTETHRIMNAAGFELARTVQGEAEDTAIEIWRNTEDSRWRNETREQALSSS